VIPKLPTSSRAPSWLTARPIAHRGLHDRSRGIIENMPSAIVAAVEKNFAVEVDIQLTADGEAMVHHDDALGRLNEGAGALSSMTAADLRQVVFKDTSDRMMSLGELCDLVDARVSLIVELKSHFDGDRKLLRRAAQVLSGYRGPACLMSFDPDMIEALREDAPHIVRGIVAERSYTDPAWQKVTPAQRRNMMGLGHIFRTRPHFVSYRVDDLPAPPPWVARNIFGCALMTWTVRTDEQRQRSARHADQMTFEGFVPEN
jgi:glycerophosphoryl diester phosphodiesterase